MATSTTAENKAETKKETANDTPVKENEAVEEKLYEIIVPITKENEEDVFVSVNKRTWLIKRGEPVKVPLCVVKQLEHQNRMLKVSMDYNRKVASK